MKKMEYDDKNIFTGEEFRAILRALSAGAAAGAAGNLSQGRTENREDDSGQNGTHRYTGRREDGPEVAAGLCLFERRRLHGFG